MEGEGATKFEDIEGGGMGEGEGAKDVSDQIETEDQLDEARKAGEEQPEDDMSKQPDIAPEDNAIEMDTQFEGKMHDLENKGEWVNHLCDRLMEVCVTSPCGPW